MDKLSRMLPRPNRNFSFTLAFVLIGVTVASVGVAVALVLGSTLSFADDAAKPQVSAAAGKDLMAAQKDMQAHKWDDMLAELDKVKANPKKNEYDEHVMNELYLYVYASRKQYQEATAPLEHIIASKFTPASEVKQRVVMAASMLEELKNYDKPLAYGNRAIQDC